MARGGGIIATRVGDSPARRVPVPLQVRTPEGGARNENGLIQAGMA